MTGSTGPLTCGNEILRHFDTVEGVAGRMPRTSQDAGRQWQGLGDAYTLLAELMAAIAVWAGIGYGLDHVFDTKPVLFAIGMVIGAGAGVYLVYRRAMGLPVETQRKGESES